MAGEADTLAAKKRLLPNVFLALFLIIEPGIIWLSLVAIWASPSDHFDSLAPANSAGCWFGVDTAGSRCGFEQYWRTPELRVLLYQFMSALAFSAVIEPLLIHTAIFRLQSVHDARLVITSVLASFAIFDIFHAVATLTVVGFNSVLPRGTDFSEVDAVAAVNVWVPMAWFVIRTYWYISIGSKELKDKNS